MAAMSDVNLAPFCSVNAIPRTIFWFGTKIPDLIRTMVVTSS